ncbi:EAL domain-containing protein [Sulfurimonas lithotrophica]|uniref:EAL domain-containing protein n=1 Tax=Sulfurimonas lithotrophica TaxID=2590022 RepID=UPI001F5278C5|nr:GGDEF and EAL domain-containing protein [Sulfurimonas lithotrophica]
MLELKSKIYLLLISSFILLFVSLAYSVKNISSNTKIISEIENKYLNLSKNIQKLNLNIEEKQSNVLQSILLGKKPQKNHTHLEAIVDDIYEMIKFDLRLKNLLQDKLLVLKKRLVSYKSVEVSVIESLNSKYKEDLEDAIIGYNEVTKGFTEDVSEVEQTIRSIIKNTIVELRESNSLSQMMVITSFLITLIIVIFSVLKLNSLQNNLSKELKRSSEAEEKQKNLQEQLLKYNENLENEITKKTNELYQKVYTHFLSGLPNRNKLLEDFQIYDFSMVALLDIDKFQKFNDVYGEEMGNLALQETAKFIEDFIDIEGANIYHVSGDEFVVAVQENTNIDKDRFLHSINHFINIYKKNIFDIGEHRHSFVMSAGISFYGAKKMLAFADMALKDAKNRNQHVSVFSESKEIEKRHKDDIECKNLLLEAFKNDGIISYFQPISPIQDPSLETKYESLVRIKKGEDIITPHTFIDVAKQNKVYYKLTRKVFQNTLATIKKYKIPCSLNISVVDIENERTVENIYEMIDNFNYNNLLTIEILETEEFKDYDVVYKFCRKIRSYGIKIALDDFGSGYSNFTHILNLPIDFIKIDSSLISNIDRDKQSQIMVETIVGLAQKINVKTIAEYVSSKEILDTVKKLKVDYAQGFYVGKPEDISKYCFNL